jgi:hypothetical protein
VCQDGNKEAKRSDRIHEAAELVVDFFPAAHDRPIDVDVASECGMNLLDGGVPVAKKKAAKKVAKKAAKKVAKKAAKKVAKKAPKKAMKKGCCGCE